MTRSVGRKPEADIFDQLAQNSFTPQFGKTDIAAELKIPDKAKAMVLGETTIVLKPGMRVGTQMERVARDWASYEMRWDLSRKLIPATLIGYHEGAFVHKMAEFANIEITPLAGTLIAKKGRSRSLGTVSDRVARHEIGERVPISRGFCLENQTLSFQYPLRGAFWTFCSPKSRFRAVATMSGCLRSCSAKSRSLTTTSPVGYRWWTLRP